MFSTNDFISKFENYSDAALIAVQNNIEGYSPEAIEAATILINKKGGKEVLLQNIAEQKKKADEVIRIKKETGNLGSSGVNADFLKKTTKSDILSEKEIHEVIDEHYAVVENEMEDQKVTGNTISGSIIGGAIATVIGGILWSLQMIFAQRIFYLLTVGLALFCYAIIKGITRKSKKNAVVLFATAISTVLACVLGWYIYTIVGYRGG